MSKKTKIFLIIVLIAIGVASRWLPHAWNTTPITAIALFASVYIGGWYSLVTIFVTMALSDVWLGTYDVRIMVAVYGSFLLAGIIGVYLPKKFRILPLGIAAFSSSLLFFVITNGAVWYFGTMYEHSLRGLIQSYAMGLPFFKNALIGDLSYTFILFGVYELVRNRIALYSIKSYGV